MDELSISQNGYRPRRYFLNVGIAGLILCFAMGIFSTAIAYWNIDGSYSHPKRSALLFGAFWSAASLLYVWLILASFREHLLLDKTSIIKHGVIRSKKIHIVEVAQIKWRNRPQGGSIVIRTLTNKLIISFDNYTKEERDELISFLHGIFAPDIQEGWTQFKEFPLQDKLRRQKYAHLPALICGLFLFTVGGFFTYFWIDGLGVRWLVIGVVHALVSLRYLWRYVIVQRKRKK